MTSDRAQADNTGRWESEGGAEPEGPATNVPADTDQGKTAPASHSTEADSDADEPRGWI